MSLRTLLPSVILQKSKVTQDMESRPHPLPKSRTLLVSHAATQEKPGRVQLPAEKGKRKEPDIRYFVFFLLTFYGFSHKNMQARVLKDIFFSIKNPSRNLTKIDLNLRPALRLKVAFQKIAKAQDVSESAALSSLHGRPKERTWSREGAGKGCNCWNNERKYQRGTTFPSVSTKKTSTLTYRASKTRLSGTQSCFINPQTSTERLLLLPDPSGLGPGPRPTLSEANPINTRDVGLCKRHTHCLGTHTFKHTH